MDDVVVVERTVRLPPELTSPGLARRVLRETLGECGRSDWRDAAELALTELVTNVVLHARTDLVLTLRCDAVSLRASVEDFSPAIPSQRQYHLDATTGRGLALVAAVTSEHGITPTSTGKAVWFTLTDGATVAAGDPETTIDAWAEDEALWPTPDDQARSVVLLGLPPTLWLAGAQHHDALLRELALYRVARDLPTEDIGAADRARAAVRLAVERALRVATDRGLRSTPLPAGHPSTLRDVAPSLDLEVSTDQATSADFAVLQDVLDEGQRLSHAGQLLVQPALPEVIALRDWVCEQVIAITAGGAPARWEGAAAEHFAQTRDAVARELDFDTTAVLDRDNRAIVVDSHNRIVGIGSVLAAEIGWDVDDLVGRRVVAIIPPTYREAHTAGFTRHLTTGEAHAIGVPLELPVLTADGTERPYRFFIEAERSASGKSVYVAHLTPVDG